MWPIPAGRTRDVESGRLAGLIEAQRPHLALWVPVLYALGIGAYFAVPTEPEPWMLAALAGALLLGLASALPGRAGGAGHDAVVVLPAAGFGGAALRALVVAAPVLPCEMTAEVEGRIVDLDRSASDRTRVLLDRVTIARLEPERTPARVRVSLDPSTPRGAAAARDQDRRRGAALAAGGAVRARRLRLPPHGLVRAAGRGRLCAQADARGRAGGRPGPLAAGVSHPHGVLGAYPAAGAGAERRLHLGDPDRRPLRHRPRRRGRAAGLEPLPHRLDLRPAHDAARRGGLRHRPLRAGAGAAAGAALAAEEARRRGVAPRRCRLPGDLRRRRRDAARLRDDRDRARRGAARPAGADHALDRARGDDRARSPRPRA